MTLKEKIYEVIFEADTPAGKAFDVALIVAVFLSILAVMLESVESLDNQYRNLFNGVEWFFTVLFTLELILRLIAVDRPFKYIFSFFGQVDFWSVIPSYLTLFIPGAQHFMIIRALRILRIFRILKLNRYTHAGSNLARALQLSGPKIIVFLGFVLTLVLIIGAIMYLVEGPESGFTSIPKSVYWAIVTMTTVGYGDIAPQTVLGQTIASLLMLVGYGIIAVPTGMVSAEMAQIYSQDDEDIVLKCNQCGHISHTEGAIFCNMCGHKL
jgi:voltage-gated potassium channel